MQAEIKLFYPDQCVFIKAVHIFDVSRRGYFIDREHKPLTKVMRKLDQMRTE